MSSPLNELLTMQTRLEDRIVMCAYYDQKEGLRREVIALMAQTTWEVAHEAAARLGLDWRDI